MSYTYKCYCFKDYEVVDDRLVFYMGDHNKAPVIVCGSMSLLFIYEKSLPLRKFIHVLGY